MTRVRNLVTGKVWSVPPKSKWVQHADFEIVPVEPAPVVVDVEGMSVEELREYANESGINVGNARSHAALVKRVLAALAARG